MVKRTITISSILLIIAIIIGIILSVSKGSFAADDDIASGTSGTCSWIINNEGILTISPTNGVEGTLDSYVSNAGLAPWNDYRGFITKVAINQGVKANEGCFHLFDRLNACSEIDLINLDTSNVTNMSHMFYYCSSITSLDLSGFDTSKVTNMHGMFSGCRSITSLDVSNFNTNNVTDIGAMFNDCSRLTALNIEGLDTSKVKYMDHTFRGLQNITSLDVTGLDTSKVTNMDHMFFDCKKLTSLDVTGFDTRNLTNMNCLFYGCESLTSIDVTGFDTSKVTNMDHVFSYCRKLTSIDVSGFDTSKVTSMIYMFDGCSKITSLDLSKFNTSNVQYMFCMFQGCSSITSLDLSSFDTGKVKDMLNMFYGCSNLKSIDLTSFNTSNVINMERMFGRCESVTNLDLSSFNTSNVTNMSGAFAYCKKLETLNISNWDTRNVTSFNEKINNNPYSFFENCDNLKKIILGENFVFDGNNITEDKDKAILPEKANAEFTEKWVREDREYGPYDASYLRDNYDGSLMAGSWVRERKKYNVTYKYSGFIPTGVSELPHTKSYTVGDEVAVEQNATAAGYEFSGWSRIGGFEMPAEDVEITGSFIANADTPYIVEHYLEDLNGHTYTLTKTDNLTGKTDTEIIATEKNYEGFTFDDSIDGTIASGNISGDGTLVLKLYYRRNSYNITYSYTGEVPDSASSLPQGEVYKYGAEIIVPQNATAEGYTFSGWIKDYITMPARDIEINGYFIEIPKSYSFKVEYYFDGELENSLEEILNAEKNEEISITPQNPLKNREKNYTLVSSNHVIIISENDDDNVIRVYYETDVLDYEIDSFENITEGDGIPDKYQIKISYKVENGSWNDGTNIIKTQILTLFDEDGKLSEQGKGRANAPDVGNRPAEGYTKGFWNKEIPSNVFSNDNGNEFVYSYEKIVKADIVEPEGKGPNPETDDKLQNYLILGVLGTLVLMTVIKVRIKYSRKAKKIQY